jgi:hypothetical protein
VVVSSTWNKNFGAERLNDGDWVPTLEPALTRTCIALLRTRASRFVFLGPRGACKTAFPVHDKELKIKNVRWCHIKQTAYFFLRPADLILKGVGHGYGRICIDHSKSDSFAVVCFPDLDLEQASRAAEAGLVKLVRLDTSAHIFLDEASGIMSAAFFDVVKGSDISTEGPAYILYQRHPELLITAKSRRAAPSDVWINAPDTKTLVVNGKPQDVYKQGPMVRVSAHR